MSDGAAAAAESQSLLFPCFVFQLEVYEVNVSPDLQQNLTNVVHELGVQIPPPVSHDQV